MPLRSYTQVSCEGWDPFLNAIVGVQNWTRLLYILFLPWRSFYLSTKLCLATRDLSVSLLHLKAIHITCRMDRVCNEKSYEICQVLFKVNFYFVRRCEVKWTQSMPKYRIFMKCTIQGGPKDSQLRTSLGEKLLLVLSVLSVNRLLGCPLDVYMFDCLLVFSAVHYYTVHFWWLYLFWEEIWT
jgi:hypothetical protein